MGWCVGKQDPRRIEINGEKGVIVLVEGDTLLWQAERQETRRNPDAGKSASSHTDPLKLALHHLVTKIANFAGAIPRNREWLTPAREEKITPDWIFSACGFLKSDFAIKL